MPERGLLGRLLRRAAAGSGPPAAKPRAATRVRDVLQLEVEGKSLQIQRLRDPRCRRMRLVVDERGARLSMPQRASQAAALRRVALSFKRLRTMPGSCISTSISSSLNCARRCASKPNNTFR